MSWKLYRKKGTTEMIPVTMYHGNVHLNNVSISKTDLENGSPKEGDMIARNPKQPHDEWLVSKEYFEDNYEPVNNKEFTITSAGAVIEDSDEPSHDGG